MEDWIIQYNHKQGCNMYAECKCESDTWDEVGEGFFDEHIQNMDGMKPRTLEACIQILERKKKFIAHWLTEMPTFTYRLKNLTTQETIPFEILGI